MAPAASFFQGVAGLPTAGITGGSHRLPRQPPTSLTDDTPNHGAWRLQKIRKYFPAIRVHGNKGIQVRGNMSLPHKIHEKRPAPIPQCGPQTANHQSVLNKIVRRNIAVLSAAVCAVEVRLWGGGGGRAGAARCGATVCVGAGSGAFRAPVRAAGVGGDAAVGGLGLRLSLGCRCCRCGGLRIRVRLCLDARVHAIDGILQRFARPVDLRRIVPVLQPVRRVRWRSTMRRGWRCPRPCRPNPRAASTPRPASPSDSFSRHPASSRPWIRRRPSPPSTGSSRGSRTSRPVH